MAKTVTKDMKLIPIDEKYSKWVSKLQEKNPKLLENSNIVFFCPPQNTYLDALQSASHKVFYISFYMSLTCLIVFLVGLFYFDYKNLSSSAILRARIEIDNCLKEYNENRCFDEKVPPAAIQACGELQSCVSSNPESKVTYSVLASQVVGQSISNLIEPISWKAIAVMAICCVGFFLVERRRNY